MNEELDSTDEGQASVRQETAARPAQAQMPGINGTDILIDFWASDKRSDTVLLHLDPATVRPWSGNPREYGHLDCLNVADLIHSIRQDGQKIPVVVRRVHGDPRHRYEIIAGTRRHWAVSCHLFMKPKAAIMRPVLRWHVHRTAASPKLGCLRGKTT